MTRNRALLLALLMLLGCAAEHASTGTRSAEDPGSRAIVAAESARIDAWFDARHEELLDFSPMKKTMLGRRDDYDRIDDFSEGAEDALLAWRGRSVVELQRLFDYDLLSEEAQTSYQIWVYEYERLEATIGFRRRRYVFTQMQTGQTRLPNFLINYHEVESEDEMRAYIARIGGTARAFDQLLERAKLHAAEGVRPPRFVYDEVLEQVRGLIRGAPFDRNGESPLWADATAIHERGLLVKRVEAYREQDGAAQHYFAGTPDESLPGVFYVHLSDMRSMPIPQLEGIAYHEGVPGHHLQISISQELTSLPEFRKQSLFTAYVEGWALYSERLSKEMGAFDDPYSDFGRLSTEMWCAIRRVVDTGRHHFAWTEEDAVAYFLANSPLAQRQVRSEVRRYLVWPGQATAYKVGMERILALRGRAQERLGSRFDIASFHDAVLGGGGLPLDILENRVEAWLVRSKDTAAAGAWSD